MQYILDTANIEELQEGFDLFPVEGVTTNPSIIAKEKKPFFEILRSIRHVIGEDAMLHVQVLGDTAGKIVREAHSLRDMVGGNLYIKIPVLPEGLKAIKKLKIEGFKVTATSILTANQALLAAKAGADYVAPYVNRIDNLSGSGVQTVADIVTMFENFNLPTKVVAASFKNAQQVHDVAVVGGHAATVPYDVLKAVVSHPMTDNSIAQFKADWERVYGEGRIICDMKEIEWVSV
ncbi:fructose-6-phosphate aldolase [Bacillus sp. AGMB 02131]|uniref:Fructose-6-phosphate aldolase n=1 Tax=Peribacillus faecalis TaxID=2772559 RepID=A0A927CXT1_9BACI|nr:fructose-6-phosphate aldolase [Peribacillus faecalis]MBD3109114.1 fructose-6-phosphate aldolase [Peribacillus faecalis]